MPRNEPANEEARQTVEAVLQDQLDAATRRVAELEKDIKDREASLKPLRDQLRAAKVEVERIGRAVKAYGSNRLKKPRKPRAVGGSGPASAPASEGASA